MFIAPMLLETADVPFDSDDHIFEMKLDGHRMIYSQEAGEVRLFTRRNQEVTAAYPKLLGSLQGDMVLDGIGSSADPGKPAHFTAFDILHYQGKDVRHLPLMRRKEILAEAAARNPKLSVIPFVENNGIGLFRSAGEQGLEGIVAKGKSGKYAVGRRVVKWQKIINWAYVDVVITGYHKSLFGWLISIQEGDELRPAGVIEHGIMPEHKKAFYAVCKSLESGSYRDVILLDPVLRARVRATKTSDIGSNLLKNVVLTEYLGLTHHF